MMGTCGYATALLAATTLFAACGGGAAPAPRPLPTEGLDRDGLVEAVRAAALPLAAEAEGYDALLDMVGDARVVLLGEATHGTHEFYSARARITQRLIAEKGFDVVAVEADWPEAFRVNRYVRGAADIRTAREALAGFEDFPVWMWRNADVLQFVEWLRAYNEALPPGRDPVGFYGIDLQVIGPAVAAVVEFLDAVDPEAAERARRRYACFGRYGDDPGGYAQAVEYGAARPCAAQVAEQARELERRRAEWEAGGREAYFSALQNARLVERAEEYFRAMFLRGVSTWNIRDRYMAEVLETLMERSDRPGDRTKVVVWAHNSHVGDARATHMGDQGEINLGQLARERWGEDALLVGFTTSEGTVTAASDWGARPERKDVRPPLAESYESIFQETGLARFLLPLRDRPVPGLVAPRLGRAIGVVYLPQSERLSHYFHTSLPGQFDAVLHFDRTRAVEPLEPGRAGRDRTAYPNHARG